MITDACYDNRILYCQLMHDFLCKKITAWNFRSAYLSQRHSDLDANDPKGHTQEYYEETIKNLKGAYKEFRENYRNKLYEKAWSLDCLEVLKEYEVGARKLDIKGEMFFMGIYSFIDEYVREYYPSYRVGFDPVLNINEKMLKEKIKAAYEVLERNKDRWI
jgi:hypothetical protein